jgi:hypothetical protein
MSNPISNVLYSELSDFIDNDNIVVSCDLGGFKFVFSIREYNIEIYYEFIDSFYRIKIENWRCGSLQNVLFLTKSKKYKKTIKKMLRTQKNKGKKIAEHMLCFALIIKNALIEQANLNSIEVEYKPDDKFDGIFLN